MKKVQVRCRLNLPNGNQKLCCWFLDSDRLRHDIGQYLGLTLGLFPDDDAVALGTLPSLAVNVPKPRAPVLDFWLPLVYLVGPQEAKRSMRS